MPLECPRCRALNILWKEDDVCEDCGYPLLGPEVDE